MTLPPPPQNLAPIPPPARAQVWLDFDGTLSARDVLDDLIVTYAIDESWKQAEADWLAGRIGSRQCLEQEFALVRIAGAELENFVDQVELDPGAVELLLLLRQRGVPHAIVSDGIDHFIRRALARHGIEEAVIRSNTADYCQQRLSLRCPWSADGCTAAHCKCSSIAQLSRGARLSIYVGDGRSDLCPARKSQLIFAKGALAQSLADEGIAFRPFSTLRDVAGQLRQAWSEMDGRDR